LPDNPLKILGSAVSAARPGEPARRPPEWRAEPGLLPYETAVAHMEARVAAIREGTAAELVWLVEHPPLYTAGTSAVTADLIDSMGLPVYRTGRGGQFTYHGPGQRVAYVMLDLKTRGEDLRAYVANLEEWAIRALARLGARAERRPGRIGLWVTRPGGEIIPGLGPREDKIAAIGVRVRRWVSYHGIAINVAPDLGHYAGIVPCGIRDHGVTSLAALGIAATMAELDDALQATFGEVFG
jgi:lipoyl(octanoyl) transferase